MFRSTKSTTLLLVVVAALNAGIVCGQTYPSRPIRLVTSEIGGGNDFISRVLAQGLTPSLGQPVIVENRPSGVIPGGIVTKSPPDGHTLLVYGGTFMIGPLLQEMPYDIFKDFSPITTVVSQPSILIVHPSLPVKSVKELVALARARPGELNYASNAIGSPGHLTAALFCSMAKVDIVRIPYKGGGPSFNALVSGQVQIYFAIAAVVKPHLSSGRIRALAITSAKPSALMPGLPTVDSSGVPGYYTASTNAVFGPAGLPEPIVRRLNEEITRVLGTPEVREKFLNSGSEPVASTPQELTALMRSEIARMGKIIKDAGIRAE